MTTIYTAIFRIARHDAHDVPCTFWPELTANHGRIACFDNEGLNEASIKYYQSTRPAKTDAEKSACSALALRFDALDSTEPTTHRVRQRLPYDALRAAWA